MGKDSKQVCTRTIERMLADDRCSHDPSRALFREFLQEDDKFKNSLRPIELSEPTTVEY